MSKYTKDLEIKIKKNYIIFDLFIFLRIKNYVFDPSDDLYYSWLIVISIAVLYNLIFIIGRSSFELLQDYHPVLWFWLDYSCDFIYLLDIFVRLRTGNMLYNYFYT